LRVEELKSEGNPVLSAHFYTWNKHKIQGYPTLQRFNS
jgi:hypothetical protein